MGGIAKTISGVLSPITDTVSHLFGKGPTDRAVQRATNNAGGALTQEQGALGNVPGLLNRQSGAIDAQGNSLGQEAGQYGQANGTYDQEMGMGDAQRWTGMNLASGVGQYLPGALNSYMASNGLNPDGSVNESFDPYGNGVGSGMISQYNDAATQQGDQMVAMAQKDAAGRGFTGANAMTPEQMSNIRLAQTQDAMRNTRDVGRQSAQEKYRRIGDSINTLMGMNSAAGAAFGNAGRTYGDVAQGRSSVGRGYGDVATGYGNQGTGYGNVAQGWNNLGSGWGQVANGYNGQAQMANSQGQQTTNNLLGVAKMFA